MTSIACREIRDMLLDAVNSAADAFRYKNSGASVAFKCFCSQDSVHTATLNEEKSTVVCTVTGKICKSRLTSSQKVWLGSSGEFVPNSCVTTENYVFHTTQVLMTVNRED